MTNISIFVNIFLRIEKGVEMDEENENLGKMFREKNKEILLNNLTLDIDRNLDALKVTTDNCVLLETNKLLIFLKNFFKEEGIKYQKEELIGIIFREKTEINKIVNNRIEQKKNAIKDGFIKQSHESENLLSNFIEEYINAIKEETEKMNGDISLDIKTRICLEFSQYIIKKYTLSDEDQIDRINSRINGLFKDTLIRRILEEIKFRDDSLKNQAIESYQKYRMLNENTYGKFAD